MNQKYIDKLASIISGYRKNELISLMNEEHVRKWANQFDESSRDIILEETAHIFENWYFGIKQVHSFLCDIYSYLQGMYGTNLDSVRFLDCQIHGESQKKLLAEIELLTKKNIFQNNPNPKHLVYIDDGLYSGQHIIKDINKVLTDEALIQNVKNIDVFVIVGYSDGMKYVKEQLSQSCKKKEIQFQLYRCKELYNEKEIVTCNGYEEYNLQQDVLWPIFPEKQGDRNIKERIESISNKKLYYCFRNSSRYYTSQIFSSEENRRVLEDTFLTKGNELLADASITKGLYPLGFSAYPSLGFGSFCAFDFNISNTCPIVLWWGNTENQDNALGRWYPLLPRNTNQKESDLIVWE